MASMVKHILAKLEAQRVEAERQERRRIEYIIADRPDKRINFEDWRHWHMHGWFVCPKTKGRYHEYTCDKPECVAGFACQKMAKIGLRGNGDPLPRSMRPLCGAKTRAGGECKMRVVPGKERCKLHGGMSSGPKSPEGRERIAEAQRRRWRKHRQENGAVA